MRRLIITFGLLIPLAFIKTTSFAQVAKSCDIGLKIVSPVSDSVYSENDTADVYLMIKNYGPDTIYPNDTIRFSYLFVQSYFPPDTLLVGDSMLYGPIVSFSISGLEQGEVDTQIFCTHLQNNGNSYNDPNSTNDSSCVTFYFKGENTGISIVKGDELPELQLYPNPAHDKLLIKMPSNMENRGGVTISIYNLNGVRNWTKTFNYPTTGMGYPLNIATLPRGVYIVKITSKMGKTYYSKLVVD